MSPKLNSKQRLLAADEIQLPVPILTRLPIRDLHTKFQANDTKTGDCSH